MLAGGGKTRGSSGSVVSVRLAVAKLGKKRRSEDGNGEILEEENQR